MNGVTKFALGSLAGVAVGSVAAMLAAPKSGRETRGDLKRIPKEYKDMFYERIGQRMGSPVKRVMVELENGVTETLEETDLNPLEKADLQRKANRH